MYRIIGADGKDYGPISADQLRQWIAERRANAATLTLAPGAAEWKPLGSLPEFSMLLAGTMPAGAPPSFTTGPAYPRKSSALAVTGLILGAISVTFGICCCYGLPFNVTGLVFSIIALGQIKTNPERYDGKGFAIAGLVLCLVSLAIALIIFIVAFMAAALGQPTHHAYRL
jgi:hypothetical protein